MSDRGTCGCGCGQSTPIAKKTRGALGHVKGEPTPYVAGHGAHLENGRSKTNPRWAGWREARELYPLGGMTCENGCGSPAVEHHHRDGDPLNNSAENVMRLCRRCHMTLDGRLGRGYPKPTGEASPTAKLTDAQVVEIRRRRAAGERLRSIGCAFGVSDSTVSAIARGLVRREAGADNRKSRK